MIRNLAVRDGLGALAAAVVGLAFAASPALAGEPLPPQGTPPPGANNFACKPPAKHPYPVVLVHGTFGNMSNSWNTAAPALERLGYCVFALDYGNSSPSTGVNGVGDIPTSAGQLATFVDQVLAKTGATKVAIVGHSQGGMMPRYYVKFLGGSAKVDEIVGLSPASHGTTNPAAPFGGPQCPACTQQVAGSPFMQKLNAGDQTPAPLAYSVIETKNDEVVTPYQSEFLPLTADGRVTNLLLQDACPTDPTDHVGIVGDPVALQYMLNALGRPGPVDPKYKPDCTGAGLASFPDSTSVAVPVSSGPPPRPRKSGPRARRPHLSFGRIGGPARRTRHHRLRVRVFANRVTVRGTVVIRVGSARGRTVGHSRAFRVRRHAVVSVRLGRALPRGRYVAMVTGRDGSGHRARAVRSFRLR